MNLDAVGYEFGGPAPQPRRIAALTLGHWRWSLGGDRNLFLQVMYSGHGAKSGWGRRKGGAGRLKRREGKGREEEELRRSYTHAL